MFPAEPEILKSNCRLLLRAVVCTKAIYAGHGTQAVSQLLIISAALVPQAGSGLPSVLHSIRSKRETDLPL